MNKTQLFLIFILFNCIYSMQANALDKPDNKFVTFISNFKNTAMQAGISEETYKKAFDNVTSPYPNIITSVKHQPEFTQDAQTYLKNRVTQDRIDSGKKQKLNLENYLSLIENKYGVDSNIVLAIWANETNYGEALKNPKVMKDAIRALASLAYYKSRYTSYAKTQLIASLKIIQKGYINREDLKSSWAGAMGQTQFIPTSYLTYAQDLNGDGKSDIINNIPDALATTANLLSKNGWIAYQPWIIEINNHDAMKLKHLVNNTYSLAHWKALNLHLKNGKNLPNNNIQAKLVQVSGSEPQYLLLTHNFKVIKAYNNSDLYALSVGLLANALKN